jgi:hypothetical protein
VIRLRVGLTLLAVSALAAGALSVFQPTPTLEVAPVDMSVPSGLGPNELGQWCEERQAAGTAGLSAGAVRWLRSCVEIFGSPDDGAGPTPTTSGTPSPGSTASPTPGATSGSTQPPTSTPLPTGTSSGGSTTVPGPTAVAQPGCMSTPSACGWPDATNTGTTGALTVVQGDVTLSTPGMVYSDRDVRGCISVRAKNVVIRNVRVTCPNWYAIGINTGIGDIWNAPDANTLIEDVEINLAGSWEIKGIAFSGYTARRVHFYGGSDCAHMSTNVAIVDSFCDIPAGGPQDGPHYDGFQSDGGRNITIQHNTIRVPYGQTSAILMSTNTSPIRDVSIVNNLAAGGGYTIYCGTDSGGPVLGTLTFSGNRIARTYFTRGGQWGPTTSCPSGGAIWDDTLKPI